MTTKSYPTRRELRQQRLAHGTTAPHRPRKRIKLRSILGETLLGLATVAGVISISLVILAYTMNITIIMFKTGSMEPAIPTGSVAFVQQTPASEVQVGDIVTVDRDEQLPVTHRVTSVEAGATSETRSISMRGDANDADDPFPYEITSVRTVLFSIPGLAPFIAQLGNPLVLGGLTLGATVLVGWAFWPRACRETGAQK